jgi:hypothetical protein
MVPNMSAELSRLHQRDLLREAEHERLVAEVGEQMEHNVQANEQRGPASLLMKLRYALLPAHNASVETRWG